MAERVPHEVVSEVMNELYSWERDFDQPEEVVRGIISAIERGRSRAGRGNLPVPDYIEKNSRRSASDS